jgi:hypothetical protein
LPGEPFPALVPPALGFAAGGGESLEATARSLSLAALHPDAAIRDVSAAELEQAKAAQYTRG